MIKLKAKEVKELPRVENAKKMTYYVLPDKTLWIPINGKWKNYLDNLNYREKKASLLHKIKSLF